MIELHLHWLFLASFITIIATYLVFLYGKDHNKRKLTFSIALYIATFAYIGLGLGYVRLEIENTSALWYNLFVFSSFPIIYAIFLAANESFLKIKNYDKIFNIFLLATIATLSLIFLPFKMTVGTNILMMILSIEVLAAVSYNFYKTRSLENVHFFLYVICSMIAGLSLSFDNEFLAAVTFLFSYVFITLLFIKERFATSVKQGGVSSFFSLEQQLKTSEEKFRQLFNSIPDAICLLSADGKILEVNKQMENNFNTSTEEIIGKNMHEILPKDIDNERTDSALKAFKTGKIQENEDKRNDMYFHNMFIPIETESKQKNLMIIARNITTEKKMETEKEEKLRELRDTELATLNIMEDMQETVENLEKARIDILDKNEELETSSENLKMINQELSVAKEQLAILNLDLEAKVQERTAEIEELLRQKDEFIGQLGHDLKTPLTPMNTLLPIIRDKVNDPKLKELLDVNIKNVEYMKNLVFKTLQLAQLSSPKAKFDLEKTNLLTEISETIDDKAMSLDEKDMAIELIIDKELFVNADSLQLHEIFNNLISNAFKYTEGAGVITIEAKEDEKGFTLVSIKDTGIGMTAEQLEHVFDDFYKADGARHDLDSHGLGLSIVKRIVEKHGGKIWVESAGHNKGSTFHFTLQSFNKNN